VGKSTIMNLLSKSDVFAENKLFATLDTTVRKVVIDNLPFLLSDTVGFIRKLPHDLVESFKSTLDEVRESDLLIHIVDVSHPNFEEQIRVVNETLRELDLAAKPLVLVFNKIDAFSFITKDEFDLTPVLRENYSLSYLKNSWMASDKDHRTVFISAKTRENIEELKDILYEEARKIHVTRYPYNNFLFDNLE
jgi:GTP-binding protein HflX